MLKHLTTRVNCARVRAMDCRELEGSGASSGDETGQRGVDGRVAQESARRVGSLWDHALQAQKKGEAAYLRKLAEREQQVPAQY